MDPHPTPVGVVASDALGRAQGSGRPGQVAEPGGATFKGAQKRSLEPLSWVAVKELKLSYHIIDI